MYIHLNLLAEAQAAEELRRRDPVKRAIWFAGFLVAVMLVWSSSLLVRTMFAQTELNRMQGKMGSQTNDFQQIRDFQKKTTDIEFKLAALHQLATNRFLNGTMLNALQQATVENFQLIRLRVEQNYVFTEEVKAKKSESGGRGTPARPATVTEKIVLMLEARDSSPKPGDEVNKLKEKIGGHPYFQTALGKTNEVRMIFLSQPLSQPDGRTFVQFNLECRYPERTR